MFISKEQIDAEYAYRANSLRSSYQDANRRARSNPRRREMVAAAGIALCAGLGLFASGEAAGAATPATESWIALNWESVEPSWEPNYSLLEAILAGYEQAAEAKNQPDIDNNRYPR